MFEYDGIAIPSGMITTSDPIKGRTLDDHIAIPPETMTTGPLGCAAMATMTDSAGELAVPPAASGPLGKTDRKYLKWLLAFKDQAHDVLHRQGSTSPERSICKTCPGGWR
jgi:hypothetical protein